MHDRTVRHDLTAVGLTERQVQILMLLARGLTNYQISLEVDLSEKTVRNHISLVYVSLGVHTRVQAALWAWHHGLAPTAESGVPLARVG
ncbi:response regulator transcription factor [Deinococcus pimensis]|uniref:response regulator transcription factor n=1 Tax=Deinococcus pimensis TaxID=309888 RepID=UPI00048645D7|nr:LuxR C-terminal-related transcriptional regulator [Deinococcus pimensis]